MYYVYVLRCGDGSFYTGIAKDLEKRLEAHRNGKGSKYVRSRLPFELIHKEEFPAKESALRREIEIKGMSRREKAEMINIRKNGYKPRLMREGYVEMKEESAKTTKAWEITGFSRA
ncbi:MAG TPA: GIY-YIG nuclease family protein [archaeon]|nr:GIY-YIG nuclease family protein [archaeon]